MFTENQQSDSSLLGMGTHHLDRVWFVFAEFLFPESKVNEPLQSLPLSGLVREDGCDGTPVMIRGPETHSSSGRGEGVWLKDSVINQDRIYVANYFFGTTLIEFRNLEHFKM
eukprot:g17755.t1